MPLSPSDLGRRVALITGATGFVGGELLAHLLATSDRRFICPVRANDDALARERGAERLAELLDAEALTYADRVTWYAAELTKDRFGWSEYRWHDIAAEVTEVFHCAASVSFDQPLAEANEINVTGTQHTFALAQAAAEHHTFRRFHQISTAFASGVKAGAVGPDFLPSDDPTNYRNTYERTKARAERWLRERASAELPITIHRPSIVCGHTKTGETNSFNVIYGPMKLGARGQLPIFPCRGAALLDSIGIDFVVQAIGVFAETDSAQVESHYVSAGPTAFNGRDLLDATVSIATELGRKPSHTTFISRMQWRALEKVARTANRVARFLGPVVPRQVAGACKKVTRGLDRCEVFVPYAFVETVFETERDHALLAKHSIIVPDGLDYLNTIVRYAVKTDFGRNAEPQRFEAPSVEPVTAAGA